MSADAPPPHSDRLAHPAYRADIDGLRAIAVLSVVGFHASPYRVPGGFIGVDVFFVISGFLISTVILGSLERERFTFVEFYARRIRRIFPALLLVLVACSAFGWFVLLPDEYAQLGKHVAAGAAFVSNFAFWSETGYFDTPAALKPLLHLWSLGIEEQFYIVWPLLVWLAWKWRTKFLALAVAVAAISFVLNLVAVRSDAAAAFYSPQTRFWELLVGSILAYVTLFKPGVLAAPKALQDAQSLLGVALIALGSLVITSQSAFPGWWALLPTAGAALVISAGARAWLNRVVLSNRAFVWVGLISYPLYLWHWPLLAFARIVEPTPSRTTRLAAVIASVVLAWITYRVIEGPIRFGKHGRGKALALLLLMIVVGCAGFVAWRSDGLPSRFPEVVKISKAAGEWEFPGRAKPYEFKGSAFRQLESGAATTTLFVGDSNIEQFYSRIDELILTRPASTHSAIFATGGQCLPIPGVPNNHPHCANVPENALELALSRSDITTVVIAAQWWGYLSAETPRVFRDAGGDFPIARGSEGYAKAMASLSAYMRKLKEGGKRVFLVLNIPVSQDLDPKGLVQRSLRDFPNVFRVRERGANSRLLLDYFGFINTDLIAIATANKVELIDPIAYLCEKDNCVVVDPDGEPRYRDAAHLRPSYARRHATFIDVTVSD